jgi:GDP-L-fucose synthase
MSKVLIFGCKGMVGKAVTDILMSDSKFSVAVSSREDTNLFSFEETQETIRHVQPDVLINAAAKVGGIVANNQQRSEFLIENLRINLNILEAAIPYENMKIINLGSSCIYPLNAKNPITEDEFMNGKLEPTNSPYAMAKLTAIELGNAMQTQYGHNVINLMPTNLYGPYDSFSAEYSHVIPGLMYRMHIAKVEKMENFNIWGSGKPLREFLYVNDLANAIKFVIENNIKDSLLNIGSGDEVSIKSVAESIKTVVGFEGELSFDKSKPDGNPRKLLDSSKILDYGWIPDVELNDGLKKTYRWFLDNQDI